jgi:hypothetical protein
MKWLFETPFERSLPKKSVTFRKKGSILFMELPDNAKGMYVFSVIWSQGYSVVGGWSAANSRPQRKVNIR